MDLPAQQLLVAVIYYLVAFVLFGVLSDLFVRFAFVLVIGSIIDRSNARATATTEERHLQLAARAVGVVERVMYMAAVLLGRTDFVGVWLVLKAVGEWRRTERGKDTDNSTAWIGVSKAYTVFLIGNALSLIAGIGSGLLMSALLPPFPSMQHWRPALP